MALIACPECGKEKVSDLAETCPECGFPIKTYYENKKKSELGKSNDIKQNVKNANDEFTNYLIEVKDEFKPKKPTILSVAFGDVAYGVLGVIVFSIFAWLFYDISMFLSIVFIFLVVCFGVGYTISAISHVSKAIEEYNDKLKRWEENPAKFFAQEMKRSAAKWTAQQKDIERNLLQSSKTICPKCGGTSFTPVRKKWDIVTGYRTNKIELICDNCGNRIDERK